jgi:hypothetical protein
VAWSLAGFASSEDSLILSPYQKKARHQPIALSRYQHLPHRPTDLLEIQAVRMPLLQGADSELVRLRIRVGELFEDHPAAANKDTSKC